MVAQLEIEAIPSLDMFMFYHRKLFLYDKISATRTEDENEEKETWNNMFT